MLFNSLPFALFLPIVFIIYWLLLGNSLRKQNIFLVMASYFFYAWWDIRFLFLLIFSTFLDYYTGQKIEQSTQKAHMKIWLMISVVINLGVLIFFKYYNFFVTSFADLFAQFGLHINVWTLNIMLPIGISFYTFHGMSYVFDIYNNKQKALTNYIDYSLFVSFFPLLVAGPIERAHHLLPQILKERNFDTSTAIDGLRQILWGMFKKIVVADNCAMLVDEIFGNGKSGGSSLFIGSILFAFQIYGDFSGYSDIALGTAKLFGFSLLRNFSYPYFARDIAEFWRSWHISLSSWFRDYLYFPLGGSKQGILLSIRNTLIIFLVSAFWHGANWTFIFWGLLHAIYFIPLLVLKRNRTNLDIVASHSVLPSFKELTQMSITFLLVVFAWIFFRAPNISSAFEYVGKIFSASFFEKPISIAKESFLLIIIMLVAEWINRKKHHALQFNDTMPKPVKWFIYYMVVLCIFFFARKTNTFIYFQF